MPHPTDFATRRGTVLRRALVLSASSLALLLAASLPARSVAADAAPPSRSVAGTGFALPWWTIDGGGGRSAGGGFILDGSLGQPDAGTLGGGSLVLIGGFWAIGGAPPAVPPDTVFRDGFEAGAERLRHAPGGPGR